MTWKPFHKCDPYPDTEGLKDGNTFECIECGKIIQYRYSPTVSQTPMGDRNGIQWWDTIRKGNLSYVGMGNALMGPINILGNLYASE